MHTFSFAVSCKSQNSLHVTEMGRRKSKRKPPPKKKLTGDLDSQFTCPFCNHEKSCDVKMYVATVQKHLLKSTLWNRHLIGVYT